MNRLSPKTVSLQSIRLIKEPYPMIEEKLKRTKEEDKWSRPLTMEEIDAILDKAEANFAAGLGIPSEVVFRQLEEDFAKEDRGTQLESI